MTLAQENYLKAILVFEMDGQQATVNTLAETLSVKPASVTEMIKKLSAMGMLEYRARRGFKLAGKGRQSAMRILRRHRLWETFLSRVLDYPWSELHTEAEKLEHITSDLLEKKIDAFLGYPVVDPHGHPIPRAGSAASVRVASKRDVPLGTLDPGQSAVLVQVSDANPSFLHHLERIGLALNTRVAVKSVLAFDQTVEIEFNHRRHFISRQMAERILVRRLV